MIYIYITFDKQSNRFDRPARSPRVTFRVTSSLKAHTHIPSLLLVLVQHTTIVRVHTPVCVKHHRTAPRLGGDRLTFGAWPFRPGGVTWTWGGRRNLTRLFAACNVRCNACIWLIPSALGAAARAQTLHIYRVKSCRNNYLYFNSNVSFLFLAARLCLPSCRFCYCHHVRQSVLRLFVYTLVSPGATFDLVCLHSYVCVLVYHTNCMCDCARVDFGV